MKSIIQKISLLIVSLLFSMAICAQVAITVDNTSGNLKNNLADKDPGSIVSLTITGTLDARDFKFMRDEMPSLVNIDLRQTTIMAYSGEGGTFPAEYSNSFNYNSYTIPISAFARYGADAKSNIQSVLIPLNTVTIGQEAFGNCTALTSFTIPSSVITIGASAFYNCTGLTSLTIPPTVNYIIEGAFSNCTGLTQIVLPPGINEIGQYLFRGCSSLESLEIPSGVTTIGMYAFEGCTSLTAIQLPLAVTFIGSNAFEGCTALATINLPAALTSMGESAFSDCTGLTSPLKIPGGITTLEKRIFYRCSKLSSIEFSEGLDSIGGSAFDGCIALSGDLALPSTLQFIGERAFANCRSLNGTLTLPPHLTFIGSFAFVDCRSLSSIIARSPYPVQLIGTNAVFEGVNKNIPLQVPFGSKDLYASAEVWKDFTNIQEENQGMLLSATTVGFAPEGESNSSITLKANVAWTASSDQSWLTVSPASGNSTQLLTLTAQANPGMASRTGTLTFSATGAAPQSILVTQDAVPFIIHTTSGNFRSNFSEEQWNGITHLIITGTMNAPDIGALRDMPLLSVVDMSGVSITPYDYIVYKDHFTLPANSLPGSIYSLQSDSSLTSIILPSTLERIEGEAFRGCINLQKVVFPSTLTYIGQNAFMNCTGLKEVKVPSSIIQLGYGVFYGCSELSTVELPEGITSLSGTFSECTSLRILNLPSTLKTIGENTFRGCVQLSQIEIPPLVTTIGMGAFGGCTGLTSALLPSSVTTIESYAFEGCSILSLITLPRSLDSIGISAFSDCTMLSSVYCYAVQPPHLDNNSNAPVFWNVDLTHCILYVPNGSRSLYQQAEQWKEFKNIVEMDDFRLPVTSIVLEATQVSTTLNVTSGTAWTASSDQTWLTITPGSANGSTTLTLTAQANASVTSRIAKVIFLVNEHQMQDIIITQKGLPATIELTAGTLSSAFSLDELMGMSRLVISGTIDARDFKTIREKMPSLTELDLSAATIAAYKGFEGTVAANLYEPGQYDYNGYYYPANEIPAYALYNGEYYNSERKIIRSILLPHSLQSIGTFAFYRLEHLDSMLIPAAVATIGSNAFGECSSLTTVVLPTALHKIPIYLFNNSGLTTVNIPASVTFIGYLAFGHCKNITTVYSNALFPPETDYDYYNEQAPMFGIDKSNITLYVPYGSRGAYAAAPNEWKEFTNVVEMSGFRLSAATLAVKAAQGSTAKAGIQSDVQWTATSDQSWLAVSPSSGTGADSITFTAEANTMDAGRIATVIISAPDVVSQTIMVIQEGKPRTIALIPGNMASVLTSGEMSGITNLTITGVMDARDFRIMRDQMPLLTYLDMSKVKIAEFQEPDPITGEIFTNRVNMIPNEAFFDQKTWKGKTSLTEVIFPQTLEKIGLRAFSNATGLTVLRFPFTMRYIEMNAFNNCPYVTSIYSYALAPPPSHDWGTSFYNVDKTNCILHVPYGSKELYAASQWWKDFQNIVEMAEFKIMTSKATLEATRDSVRMRIQSQVSWTAETAEAWLSVTPASANDEQVVTITAEANTTDMLRTGTVIFRATGYLPQVYTVTQKGQYKSISLTAGALPSMLTHEELQAITGLIITGTMDARDFKVIRDHMPWLGYLDITGATITAYSGTEGTAWGDYAYKANAIPPVALYTGNENNKSSLSTVLLPTSITLIDGSAFGESCPLSSLIIPPSVNTINPFAFYGTLALPTIVIPEGVDTICNNAFSCSQVLSSVTIPSSIKYIGDEAFGNLNYLRSIYSYAAVPLELSDTTDVFWQAYKDSCTLYVPYGSKALYAAANQWKDFIHIVEMDNLTVGADPSDQIALPTVTDQVQQLDTAFRYYPNPFADQLTIEVTNPVQDEVIIDIYSISGQKIKTLLRAQKGVKINCSWNGTNDIGQKMPGGVYLLKVNDRTGKVVKR